MDHAYTDESHEDSNTVRLNGSCVLSLVDVVEYSRKCDAEVDWELFQDNLSANRDFNVRECPHDRCSQDGLRCLPNGQRCKSYSQSKYRLKVKIENRLSMDFCRSTEKTELKFHSLQIPCALNDKNSLSVLEGKQLSLVKVSLFTIQSQSRISAVTKKR